MSTLDPSHVKKGNPTTTKQQEHQTHHVALRPCGQCYRVIQSKNGVHFIQHLQKALHLCLHLWTHDNKHSLVLSCESCEEVSSSRTRIHTHVCTHSHTQMDCTTFSASPATLLLNTHTPDQAGRRCGHRLVGIGARVSDQRELHCIVWAELIGLLAFRDDMCV